MTKFRAKESKTIGSEIGTSILVLWNLRFRKKYDTFSDVRNFFWTFEFEHYLLSPHGIPMPTRRWFIVQQYIRPNILC